MGPDVTLAALEQAHLQRSFAVIKSGAAEQKAELRAAYEALAGELARRRDASGASERIPAAEEAGDIAAATERHPPDGSERRGDVDPRPEVAGYPKTAADARAELLNPFSFDSWVVNALALPLIVALAWLANQSPLAMLLRGFHVWIHEFGHASVAWMSGYRALPLPIGWTNVESEKAAFVYHGVLFLLAVMFWAGWKERKIWAMLLPLALAPVQAYMTWKMPEHRYELWMAFGGVGGEFALSAVLMALFFVHLPEKFRWGACRYVCAFLGATSFLNIWQFWRKVARFEETIPYGSMVHGEEDGNGDMNILRLHGWRETEITHTYTQLGLWCLIVLAVVWLIFATRLDRPIDNPFARIWPESWQRGGE
ncbi:MAG: hypothetical protein C0518_07905 [Opitutus sp.]|nr:hypothetical protein [Opitutus sp.]